MNSVTIITVLIAVIAILLGVVWAERRDIKELKKRKSELENSYFEAQRNIAFLVKHQKEIADIKTAEGETLDQIAGAKTDEEIFEIINNVVAINNSKL